MPEQEPLAPEYRYYTVDLLSNQILAEIPFRGVAWERALKGAGAFSGKIPVIPATKALNLYETTMPGKTALFVVRNNICVWGGIIWDRQYNVVTRDLDVGASEFTSYFHHRKIWKTWNHEFGATIVINNGVGYATFDYGSNVTIFPGSSVHLDFYEPSNFQYNGYYRVAGSPAPTLSGFEIIGGTALADIASVEVISGVAYITTTSNHGFNTGDKITVSTSYGSPFNGSFVITSPAGSETNLFTFPVTSGDITRAATTGTAVRPVPDGTYVDVTIAVRTDTYDYVRTMIDSVFVDFVGTEFPNVYIEPGISYGLKITNKELTGGYASITTEVPHNLAIGQAVQIQDLGVLFDGEFEVLQTPSDNVLMYAAGGTLASAAVIPKVSSLRAVALYNNIARFDTAVPHNLVVGETVNIFVGYDYPDLNGDWVVESILSTTRFLTTVVSSLTIPSTNLTNATATVGASTAQVVQAKLASNVATLTTDVDHGFTVGNSVTVAAVNRTVPIVEKALDAPNSVATVTTTEPHGFSVGSVVSIAGLRDASAASRITSTTSATTITTSQGHNFKVGDSLAIGDMVDSYLPASRGIASNVATVTMSLNHNIEIGSEIVIGGIFDFWTTTTKMLSNNVATIGTSVPHNIRVNDLVIVSGITDLGAVVSKEAVDGIAVLTLSAPHNFLEAQEVTITGVGAPFDGTFTLLSVTDTRVLFEIPVKDAILPATSPGTVSSADSFFNGEYVVSAISATSFSYVRGGQNITSVGSPGVAKNWSVLNGTFTTTGRTATAVTFALVANNQGTTAVVYPADEDDVAAPLLTRSTSIFNGTHTLTAVTRNTVTFAQTISYAISPTDTYGKLVVNSIFNGARTITAVTPDTFKFTLAAVSNILEETPDSLATASSSTIFNGTYTITAVDAVARTFTYARVQPDIDLFPTQIYGIGTVQPVAVISTFGPFPGNANIGMAYSTRQYSGVNVAPVAYRGFELKNVGEALDAYSDSLDGFEYRIDCSYDLETKAFTKTFVLLPINFPNPPAPGEIAPLSRYGADKLVFEYPGGSITDMQVTESAEDSATRFFAIGSTDLGPDAGPNISIASAQDLLSGSNGDFRRWPILDDEEKIDDVDDETVLYAYAQRYLAEARPPDAKLTISVNGSIAPVVGTYSPGDWCALIIDDEFIRMRLASDLEPRDDVIVRKIDGFKVSVPDGVTFPEKVSLTLVPEWEVDKRGKSSI